MISRIKLLKQPCYVSWQYLKIYWQLLLMSAKPYQVPNSKVLLFVLSVLYLSINVVQILFISDLLVANAEPPNQLQKLTVFNGFLVILVSLVESVLAISVLLFVYKKQNRAIRVLSCVIGVEILFSLVFSSLALFFSPFAAVIMIITMYWQFMVYIYIFSHSIDDNVLVAGIFALAYILLQHNVVELMLNIFMKVG